MSVAYRHTYITSRHTLLLLWYAINIIPTLLPQKGSVQ